MEVDGATDAMEQSANIDQPDDTDLNLSSVSDTSLPSSEEEGNGPKTPPIEPHPLPESSLVNVSDISSDLDNEQLSSENIGEAPANQTEMKRDSASVQQEMESVTTNQPVGGEDAPGNQPVAAESMVEEEGPSLKTGGVEEEIKSADAAELSGVMDKPSGDDSAEGAGIFPVEDVPHQHLVETLSLQGSAPSSPTAVGTPTKTPGKRKVNTCQTTHRHCLVPRPQSAFSLLKKRFNVKEVKSGLGTKLVPIHETATLI